MPPVSSKNRSITKRSVVGNAPSSTQPAVRYAATCWATARSTPARPSTASIALSMPATPAPPQGRLNGAAQIGDGLGELGCSAGASPNQNGTVGGAPSASTTRTVPGSTRRMRHDGAPEKEHVACHRLDGPVLVDSADKSVLGLEHDAEVGDIRDRTPGGHSRKAGAAPWAEHAVHPVAMQVRPASAPSGDDAFADELHDRLEVVEG